MKISRKILTFVAPIATVATIVPIATSCNNEKFDFNYGDSINCYEKLTDLPNVDVHSLEKVKTESAKKVNAWTQDTVTDTELADYANMSTLEGQHNVYYDIVASLANIVDTKFAFTWANNGSSIKYYVQDKTIASSNTTYLYKYEAPDGGVAGIYIHVTTDLGETWQIRSYAFKGVTKA